MREIPSRVYLHKNNASQLPDRSGVYFLYQKGNFLVYIGKALSLLKRIPNHDAEKEYVEIGYELCHWSRARQLEKKLINLYEKEHGQLPYYNKIH